MTSIKFMSSAIKKARPVEVVSAEEAAGISLEIARRFGRPQRAVSAKTIMNYLDIFRHLFLLSGGEPASRQRFQGVRLKAWRNHVEGRLCLGRRIFDLDGYDI
ncbi:hypothetical protein LJB86_01890 [Deltaproteobacteria bacterium OttesenSCG-928-M10]|nr:hypothetical protein [Deltaproteobacteria bacterium OttesenSCG-928-M10]